MRTGVVVLLMLTACSALNACSSNAPTGALGVVSELEHRPIVIKTEAEYDRKHRAWITDTITQLRDRKLSRLWPSGKKLLINIHPTHRSMKRIIGAHAPQLRAYTTKDAMHLLTPTMWEGSLYDHQNRVKHEYVHWLLLNRYDKETLDLAPAWFHEGVAIALSNQEFTTELRPFAHDACIASVPWKKAQQADYEFGGHLMGAILEKRGRHYFEGAMIGVFDELEHLRDFRQAVSFDLVFEDIYGFRPCARRIPPRARSLSDADGSESAEPESDSAPSSLDTPGSDSRDESAAPSKESVSDKP